MKVYVLATLVGEYADDAELEIVGVYATFKAAVTGYRKRFGDLSALTDEITEHEVQE